MTRLFIVEDHATLIVSSMRFQFRPKRDGITVTGFAMTVEEAIIKADPASFDLFILDLHIPGHNPLDNIRKLKAHFPGKPIAIYTAESSASWRKRMMDEGALTYITKDTGRDVLKIALQMAARGESVHFGQKGLTGRTPAGEGCSSGPVNITPVQDEIITLLSQGLTHKEISSQIGLCRSVIEKNLNELRTAFNVKNNLELISLMMQQGYI
jgi:DNA-binding NarL/FixJ family response regulator